MDLDLLSKILRELVLIHNRVSLPGMGSFIAEKAPSVFSDRAMVIHPPFRRILFRPSEIWNDELLETKYAQEQGYKIEVAKHEIAEFIKRLKVDLNTNKTYRIPDFGTMRATEQNDYFFVADRDLFNYLETFGLEAVNIKFLPRKGEVESLNGKAISNFFKTDIRSILNSASSFIQDGPAVKAEEATIKEELVNEGMRLSEGGEILLADEPVVLADEPVVLADEPVVLADEPVVLADVPTVQEESFVLEDDELVEEVEPIAALHIVETLEQPIQSEPLISLVDHQSNMPPVIVVQPISIGKPQPIKDKPGTSKFIKRVVITLGIIFALILIMALLVLFKEELRPFWEWILYNKEDRELIRSSVSSLL